jgi:hypothetical protein
LLGLGLITGRDAHSHFIGFSMEKLNIFYNFRGKVLFLHLVTTDIIALTSGHPWWRHWNLLIS